MTNQSLDTQGPGAVRSDLTLLPSPSRLTEKVLHENSHDRALELGRCTVQGVLLSIFQMDQSRSIRKNASKQLSLSRSLTIMFQTRSQELNLKTTD